MCLCLLQCWGEPVILGDQCLCTGLTTYLIAVLVLCVASPSSSFHLPLIHVTILCTQVHMNIQKLSRGLQASHQYPLYWVVGITSKLCIYNYATAVILLENWLTEVQTLAVVPYGDVILLGMITTHHNHVGFLTIYFGH